MGGGAWPFLVGGAICLIIAIVGLQRGIASKRESSARVDYVPALCTHRPSLLPLNDPVNLRKDHCRTLETKRRENNETSLSVGRFLIVPADSVVMRSSMPKTSVLVGSYA
ncbi:hypothetical protein YC2023_071737 [Brassica napus]